MIVYDALIYIAVLIAPWFSKESLIRNSREVERLCVMLSVIDVQEGFWATLLLLLLLLLLLAVVQVLHVEIL